MASIAFPTLAKKATLADGTTYGYVTVAPASASKPTFLLLHGYPSSSYDWRHQIEALPKSGYGVLAPDLLGYGDTDKPGDVGCYRMKTMAGHMIELLDIEKVQSCIAVGHDWGVGLLSRLPTYHTDRFLGIVPISVSYLEPGFVLDADAFNDMTENAFGYAAYGYWKWHNTEEAVKDCDENPASVFSLFYPTDPELFKTDLGPVGKAAAFVTSGQTTASPSWYSTDEQAVRSKIFDKGGYRGPLNWYKAATRGVNSADEAEVPPEKKLCLLPTLLIISELDYVARADMQIPRTKEWCPNLRVKTLDCGHWIQLERPAVVNALLEEFAAEVCK
ncbi:hypothetical protein EPUS_08082 [Endocarpon pusillum Z07020]|uniref:AB hydrolase-1 domain-containing protein n=1 Tax=Endocarpon pusillum (strain Z07020 / HMAS-L-300199) TaxID=1263415 RepID=U1FVR1_ENDPU|nr:uncharacterized protein EPUS_08082 [Endocarpon pusillum Z07020]ERF68922.1 hypothetical protein EPUS_08082 [Endocarpon pusillum Z07020]